MKKSFVNMVAIMVVLLFVGLFGFLAGSTADETVEGRETTATKVVTEIDNAFWITDEILKVL